MLSITIKRPSMPLAAAVVPSARQLPVAPAAFVVMDERASVARVHQVKNQAELVLAGGINVTGGGATGGFEESTILLPLTGDARGVPPRGRPA